MSPPCPERQGEIPSALAHGEATTLSAANGQSQAGVEEGRSGDACSLQSAPRQQTGNPTFSSP